MGVLHKVFTPGLSESEIRERESVISEALKTKKLDPKDISLRELTVTTLGYEALEAIISGSRLCDVIRARNATTPVMSSAFSNITGNIALQGIMEGFQNPEFTMSNFVTPETQTFDGGKTIGTTHIKTNEYDDEAAIVNEGEEYPDTRFGETYVDLPASKKRGRRCSLTREDFAFDRTGQLISRGQEVGYLIGLNRELRFWKYALNPNSQYKLKGAQTDIYQAANEQTNTSIVDYTDIDELDAKFADMKDPDTGLPIIVNPQRTLIAMPTVIKQIQRIKNTLEITETSGSRTSKMANPVADFTLVTSQWAWYVAQKLAGAGGPLAGFSTNIKNLALYGDPKKMFKYITIFPLSVETIGTEHSDAFDRDVVMQFKASERGTVAGVSHYHMIYCIPAAN